MQNMAMLASSSVAERLLLLLLLLSGSRENDEDRKEDEESEENDDGSGWAGRKNSLALSGMDRAWEVGSSLRGVVPVLEAKKRPGLSGQRGCTTRAPPWTQKRVAARETESTVPPRGHAGDRGPTARPPYPAETLTLSHWRSLQRKTLF